MTTPKLDPTSQPADPNGERFLHDLDAALQGQDPDGAHADTARFAAQLAGVLQSQDAAAPENLRQKIEAQTPVANDRKPSTVVRMDHALRRYRLGVLDVAAIVALTVFGILIWRSLQKENVVHPIPSIPKTESSLAAEDGKPPAPREEPPLTELQTKLQRKVSFEFVDTQVVEAFGFLQNVGKIPLRFSPKIEADPDLRIVPVSLRVKDISLAAALYWNAQLAGMKITLSPDTVFVDIAAAAEPIVMQIYDAKDLPVDATLLAKILPLAPTDAPFAAGLGASVEVKNGDLIVAQTRAGHARAAEILNAFRKQAASGHIDFQLRPQQDWQKAIHKMLQPKVSFEFVDTPVDECISFLDSICKASFVIDRRVRENMPQITLRVQEMDTATALNWILRLSELDYKLDHEVVYIYKPLVPRKPELVGYNVSKIVKEQGLTETAISEMIQKSIWAGTWNPNNGTSILESDGWLFVNQDFSGQTEIGAFLDKLSKTAKKP